MSAKKFRASIGLATIGMLVLGACGGGGDNDAAGGDNANSGDGKVTLTVATFNEFGYDDLYQQYMEENPNITIEARKAATSNEARDNMNTRLAAGSGLADVEAIELDWLPELMVYSDKFTDLADPELEDRWLEWKTEAATASDGRLIGYGTDSGPQAVCYRADLFAKAGLPTDRNEVADLLEGDWDTYFGVGKQFVDATGIPWYDGATGTYQGMLNQIENPFEENDDTVIPLEENTQIHDLYNTLLTESVDNELSAGLAQWSEDWVSAFQNDGFATMMCPPWMLGIIEGNAAGVEGWDIAPVFPGGGGNWGGSYLTVPEQSAHPEEAKALAAWLTAPEQQITAFKTKGNFPSQVEALDSEELATYTDPFFNDAPVGEIFAEQAKAITVQPYKGPHFFPVTQVVTDALTRVDVDGIGTREDSWKTALSEFDQLGLN